MLNATDVIYPFQSVPRINVISFMTADRISLKHDVHVYAQARGKAEIKNGPSAGQPSSWARH